MACADPGVFTGARNENFEEFVRRFKRKYQVVIGCEATLIDILGDDHLGGRAKSVVHCPASEDKGTGSGFCHQRDGQASVAESTAGRLRALTELRSLKMGPDQEVAEFCILLEKLGKQANPDCTIEDRSLEYAQILLDNLSDWPEHFQLVGALHRVDPRRAYEEIKQLALSIEQSKIMFGGGRRTGVSHWKNRAAQYRDHGGIGKSQRAKYSNNELDYLEGESPQIRENYWQSDYQAGTSSSAELHMQTRQSKRSQQGSSRESVENRKCYRCSKFGHIAKDCPQLSARVNQLKGEMTVSEIIRQARNLEMTVKKECGNRDLVGGRIVKQLRLLGGNNPALLDTGSMVSVIPVEILAKARDRGFDVDALKLVEKSQLAPVLDASNKEIDFLGAVYVEAKLEGGNRASVPFYISPSKNEEIILGTNALNKLGVRVSIVGEKKKMAEAIQVEQKKRERQ
ncbi:zinc knuckle [Ostertagia ostertagi]